MTIIACPSCGGKGESLCFVDRLKPDGELTGNMEFVKCSRCNGKTVVDERMLTWIEQGKAIRQQRVHGGKYVDMHTRAVELGMRIAEYSSLEMGNVDNTWLFEWLGLGKKQVTL